MKDLKTFLESSKIKVTPQRLAILKSIEKYGHASVDEIYSDIINSFPSISLATIYKNLKFLEEAEIIMRISLLNKDKFEIKKEPHFHFICTKCGYIADFENRDLSECISNYYPHTTQELHIYGICPKCK